MRAFGSVSTSSTSEVAINGTTYNEPTSGAQRALKSSSANDAAAGTGARKVRITYYALASDGTITGPFTELITLNGTAAVATVATNIALVERMDVTSVGSGGVPAGTLTLAPAADGTGTAIGTIAAGKRSTEWAHHYVSSGKRCAISDLIVVGGDAAQAAISVRAQSFPTANVPETSILSRLGVTNATPTAALLVAEQVTKRVAGPARVRAYVTPANTNAQVTSVDIGLYEL